MPGDRDRVVRGRWRLALLALPLALAAAGCDWRDASGEEWAARTWRELSRHGLAGQLVIAELALPPIGAAASGDTVWLALLRQIRDVPPGGVLIRSGTAEEVAYTLPRLQAASRLPLLSAASLDRGLGGEIAGGTELPLAGAAARLLEPDDMVRAGRVAAREARALGVNFGLLRTARPALLPSVPSEASAGLGAYLAALGDHRVAVAVDAFTVPGAPPGAAPVLAADRAWLEAGELPMLRAVIARGVAGVLLPSLALPAATGDSLPLAFSPAAAALLRRDLGFGGVLLADLREEGVLVSRFGDEEAAVRAVAAGADLLLGVVRPAVVVEALVSAVENGRLPRRRLEEASLRVLRLKGSLDLHRRQPSPGRGTASRSLRRPDAVRLAERLFARSALALGTGVTAAAPPAEGMVLVTAEGRGGELGRTLSEAVPALRHVRVGPDAASAGLAAALAGARRVLYAEFTAGDAGIGTLVRDAVAVNRSGATTLEVRFAGGSADAVPASPAALVVWGTGEPAERVAAEILTARREAAAHPPALAWPPARTLRAGAAEAGMSEAALARAAGILRQAIAERLFPGAALAVGRRGVLVRLRGYGHLSRDDGAPPVDPERTLYDLASLTKVVGTTAAAMRLVDDGAVELDAPVARYLPDWRAPTGPQEPGHADRERVTIRHLLAHTAGLPAGMAIHPSSPSPEAALSRAIGARLVLNPGAVALYSDIGMIVLAEALSRAAAEPLDVYLARSVFRPLGMASTMYLPPLALRDRIAPSALTAPDEYELQGIVHDGTAFRLGGVAGHAGLFSTASDLAVFAQAMLNGGAYGVRRVFEPSTIAAFRARQPQAAERALGWDTPAPESSVGSYFSAFSFGHTGFTGTSLWIDPAQELFVVLLTNRTYDRTSLLRMLALRQRLHDAVAHAIVDQVVRKRPGAVDVIAPPHVRPPVSSRRR